MVSEYDDAATGRNIGAITGGDRVTKIKIFENAIDKFEAPGVFVVGEKGVYLIFVNQAL